MKLKIYNALKKYKELSPHRFHMPGHKSVGIKEMPELDGFLSLDTTELGVIDNENVLRSAEEDVKELFGVFKVRFITGGSSSGILSSVYALKDFGKKIIINRSAHVSVYNAIGIAGLKPVIIANGRTEGIADLPDVSEIEKALKDKDVSGAVLTYPDYYGRVFDIEKVYSLFKENGKYLIIDGAHGAHFFATGLKCPYQFSDVAVVSAHKTLKSANQGGAVFINNASLADNVENALSVFNTTSPCYPILATVEYGLKHCYYYGKKEYNLIVKKTEIIKKALKDKNLKFIDLQDGFKLAVDFGGSGFCPYGAEKELEKNGVFAEMNDGRYLLFMLSFSTGDKDIKKLAQAISSLKLKKAEGNALKPIKHKRKTDYLSALNKEWEYTPLNLAEGKVSAENVGIFPPCYPVITAGEIITEEDVAFLSGRKNTFNIKNGKIKTVKEK